ncbi:MAG: TIGR03067 domain-containing protein [Planctomycetaceae bacterium]|nr:TIGR03067 domain-containing protein [Planctomycetaceae bacterium]
MNKISFRAAAIGAAILCLAPLVVLAQTAADTKEEATKKDQLAIEGTWLAISLEVNGNAVGADDVKKITTENGRDGEWTLLVEGKDVSEGTSTIDPTVTPKTIDFKTTKGNNSGQTSFGIYEISGKIRKLCIAEQGRPRPADFSATAGSGRMLVVFERVDPTK